MVAKENEQKPRIDFEDTFAPVAKWATINTISALIGHHSWDIKHMDVKTAFLNGKIQDEVYMRQPPGFIDPTKPTRSIKSSEPSMAFGDSPEPGFSTLIGTSKNVASP
jgi:hypothetical protein